MIVRRPICVMLAASIVLSGCGSILNPHVRAPAMDRPIAGKDGTLSGTFVGDLPRAIDDAGSQVKAYVEAAADHSRFRSASILALLPLSAVALYKGITSDSPNRNNLTALGLLGGTIYFGGSLFYSDTRQRVYLEGVRAIECSIAATRPYLIAMSEYQRFPKGEEAILAAMPLVVAAIQRVQLVDTTGEMDPEWHKRVTTEVRTAQRLLARGNTALTLTKRYQSNVTHAAFDLRQKVHAITISVSQEVIKTEPNWAALAGLRAGVNLAAGQFGQVSAAESGSSDASLPAAKTLLQGVQQSRGSKTAAQRAKEAEERAKAQEEKQRKKLALEHALSNLAAQSGVLAAAVNAQYVLLNGLSELKKSTQESMKACEPAGTKSPFRISPDAAEINLMPGTNYTFAVFGSTGLPRAVLSGAGASRLELRTTADGQFLVSAKNDVDAAIASGNDAQLDFFDAAPENRKSVHITIGQATPKPDTPEPIKRDEQVASVIPPVVVKDPKVVCVQTKLAEQGFASSGIDGILGPKTKADIRRFTEKKGLTPTEEMSPEVLAALQCGQ